MQVEELAEDLEVSVGDLLALLRAMGIPARDAESDVRDAAVAKVLARVERERRSGNKTAAEAVQSALEESQTTTRRRRRRRVEPEPEPESAAEPEAESSGSEEESGADVTEGDSEVAEPAPGVDATKGDESSSESEPAGSETPDRDEAEAKASADASSTSGDDGGPEEAPDTPDSDGDVAASGEDATPDAPAPEKASKSDAEPAAEAPAPEKAPAAADKGETKPAAASGDAEESSGAPKVRRKVKPKAARGDSAPASSKPKPVPAASAGPGGQVRIQADGYTSDGRRSGKKRGKKRQRVDQDAVQDNIQRVMAELKGGGGGGGGRKRRRNKGPSGPTPEEIEQQEEQARQKEEEEAKTVRVNEFLTVAELSELIDVPSNELVGAAFKNLGLMITINQRLDFDQIELLLDEFNFKAMREEEYAESSTEMEEEEEDPDSLELRAPVVTVMGHVDHGKTLLLDSIRKTNVVAGESGGITQHIGAYHVELDDGRSIAFLDTPGHAAFTAMRARGADITDIVILVVAADDSIMPQTVEAISHAKSAGVPLVVAINKMDLPAADAMRVKQELLQHEVTVEDFGGEVLYAEISAKSGKGIDDLLEKVLLQAELLELTANPDRDAVGTVIESKLDIGKGAVVSVLVQKGTLKVGESFICGTYDGRVRAMLDERGKPVESAGPAVPVQILGVGGVPQAGDIFRVMDADQAASIAQTRQRLEREKTLRVKDRGMKLGDLAHFMEAGDVSRLPLLVKADVDGSVQAVADSLEQLSTSEVQVDIIHRSVGAVNESDVLLAETTGSVIIGFRVRPDTKARNLAEERGVDVRSYDVIYEAVEEVRKALEGMLTPDQKETVLGAAEVREIFRISKVGAIAGCYVTDGVIDRNSSVRVIRDGSVVYDGDLESLKRFKDDAREVREGFECGLSVANFNDIKTGDFIESYKVEEVARTLEESGSE